MRAGGSRILMPAFGVVFFLLVCIVQLQCDGFYLIMFYFVTNK